MIATRRTVLAGAAALMAARAGASPQPVPASLFTSLGCGHCARFHLEELPQVRAERIDTGAARLDIRPFPLDPRSLAGFMLLRALPDPVADQVMDRIFEHQAEWITAPNATPIFRQIMIEAGLSATAFDRALNDASVQADILSIRSAGLEVGVRVTPTFKIGTELHAGALSADDLITLIDQQT